MKVGREMKEYNGIDLMRRGCNGENEKGTGERLGTKWSNKRKGESRCLRKHGAS